MHAIHAIYEIIVKMLKKRIVGKTNKQGSELKKLNIDDYKFLEVLPNSGACTMQFATHKTKGTSHLVQEVHIENVDSA